MYLTENRLFLSMQEYHDSLGDTMCEVIHDGSVFGSISLSF